MLVFLVTLDPQAVPAHKGLQVLKVLLVLLLPALKDHKALQAPQVLPALKVLLDLKEQPM